MKTKFLIPVLAAIFAIGMSFTTLDRVSDPNTDYYLNNGILEPIGVELNCGSGSMTCQVQFKENGPVYDVYDSNETSSLKRGNGDLIELWR